MMKYSGISHRALLFAKMKNRPLSLQEFVDFSPKTFEKPSRVVKAMRKLQIDGFMAPVGTQWKITKSGIAHIYAMAKPYRGE
jgi:hypothetical protein